MNNSLSSFAPENLATRDRFGRPVPRHPALSSYTQAESGDILLKGFLPLSAAAFIYLFIPPMMYAKKATSPKKRIINKTEEDTYNC